MHKNLWLILIVLLLLGVACSGRWPSDLPSSNPTSPPFTSTLRPTTAPTIFPTWTPTSTPTPTPTPLVLPVLLGTAYPTPVEPISPDNVDRLKLLAAWGSTPTYQLAWLPDSQSVVLGSWMGVFIRRVPSGELIRFLPSHHRVNAMAISPDGQYLAYASRCWYLGYNTPPTLEVWQIDGDRQYRLEVPDCVSSLAFSPDSRLLAIGLRNGLIQLRQVEDGKHLKDKEHIAAAIAQLHFLPEGQGLLFATQQSRQVHLWDFNNENVGTVATGPAHPQGITNMVLSPSGSILATSGGDGALRVWNREKGNILLQTKPSKCFQQFPAFSPDEEFLAVAGCSTLRIWHLPEGQEVKQVELSHTLTALAFSPDNKWLALGYHDLTLELHALEDHPETLTTSTPIVWTYLFPAARETLPREGQFQPHSTSISGNGELFAAPWERKIGIWHMSNGQLLTTIDIGELPTWFTVVRLSPDGSLLAVGLRNFRIGVWQVADGQLLHQYPKHLDDITGIAFTPDSQFLISASADGTVKVWQATDGKFVRQLEKPPQGAIDDVAVSPDGRFIAAVTSRAETYVWNASTGLLLYVLRENGPYENTLAFSADSTRLFVGLTGPRIYVWKVGETRVKLLGKWSDSKRPTYSPHSFTFAVSPDGQLVAMADRYNGLRLLKFDGQKFEEIWQQQDRFFENVIGFSADGRLLITANDAGFNLWAVQP